MVCRDGVPVRLQSDTLYELGPKRETLLHFWAIGYGAWSTGNITEEMVQEYLEHHRDPSNRESNQFILE